MSTEYPIDGNAHRNPSPGRPRSERSHEAILNAASDLLKERGHAAISIEAIAAKAGVGKQTIYRWWPNKAAILKEIYQREAAFLFDTPDLGSFEAELVTIIVGLWHFWQGTASGQAFRSFIAEAQSDPNAMIQLRDEFMPKRRVVVTVIVERAQKRGELPVDLDIETMLDLIYGFMWYQLLTDQPLDEPRIKRMVQAVLSGAIPRR